MESFRRLGINKEVLEALRELQFTNPTEIQEESIPFILKGKDTVGQAATGSGKTLAFGCGIIAKAGKGCGVQALILTPTRELAGQVANSLRKFSKYIGLNIQEIYGGVSINPQIFHLRKADVVVGTPGRILDHLARRTLDLSKINILVLDEADRMADMGFLPDVEKIIKQTPKRKQTLLFSATITQDVDYISRKYMQHPVFVTVKSYVDPSKLKQVYYDVPKHQKFSLLFHLLKQETSGLVMVFCNTRRNTDILEKNLRRYGLKPEAIHGGLSQNKRGSIMRDFHSNKVAILICTDVAARGLDIKNVSHVYNYDLPKNSVEYIHRIGRTARAGKEGEAISLVSNTDYQNFDKILSDKSLKIMQVIAPEFQMLKPNFSKEKPPLYQARERFMRQGRRSFRHGRR